MLLLNYSVLEAARVSTAKAGEQLSLPPAKLAVTFGYVSSRMPFCFAFAIQKQQD